MSGKREKANNQRRKPPKDWLRPGGEMQPWIDALLAVDQHNDIEALLNLLRALDPVPFPFEARWHLADLFERYKLAPTKKSRRIPSYDRGEQEKYFLAAEEQVVEAKHNGIKGSELDALISLAARVRGLNEEAFRSHLAGKYGSTRRLKKRRPPKTAPSC